MARYPGLLQTEVIGNNIRRNSGMYLTADKTLTFHKTRKTEQRSCENVKSGRDHAVWIYTCNAIMSQIFAADYTLSSLKSNQFIILRPTGLIMPVPVAARSKA
jgi:hypothetical protein